MGVISDRLDGMRVRVLLPGGEIAAELHGRSEVYLSFAPGAYRRSRERELEGRLANLARLLWAGRMREYYAAVSEAFGEVVTGERPPIGPRDQDFVAARDELRAEGRSSDGRVYLAVRGMREWTVRIADGTLRALDENEFGDRVREAAAELIRDQVAKIRVLKERCYG